MLRLSLKLPRERTLSRRGKRESSRMKRLVLGLLSLGLLSTQLFAANILITVDELGTGTLVNPVSGTFVFPSSLAADPGPGGLASALTYNMLNPPGLVVGDVILLESPAGL